MFHALGMFIIKSSLLKETSHQEELLSSFALSSELKHEDNKKVDKNIRNIIYIFLLFKFKNILFF